LPDKPRGIHPCGNHRPVARSQPCSRRPLIDSTGSI
jgi:hypothetical protein